MTHRATFCVLAKSMHRQALSLLLLSWALVACSGSRDDALNTNNIGRSDAAVVVDEDAESEDVGDGEDAEAVVADGDDGGESIAEIDSGGDATIDAGDFDAIVSVQVADAGEAPDTTVIVETPLCGNGTVDPEEQCDQGPSNSDTVAGACRLNCRSARCGDGVVDQGEACDQGASNSDSDANACRANCTVARCGDSVVDQGEQCDTGAARSDTAAGACRLSCRSARCGDGVRDNDEGCDDGNPVDTDACRNNCRSARCGDNVLDPDEECDDGNTNNADACRDTCRRPICGDRVVDPGEQCDDGNQVNNDGCRSNCRTGCANDAACSDGLFCTGVERCVDGLCNAGVGINPDDNVGCTADVCREDLDRVVHTPNDALCVPPGPTCNGARGTTRTALCNATTGCVVRETSTACSDEASYCEQRGDGSFTLQTFTPACENTMSCGDASQASRVCAHIPASCNNRVFTSRANATCNPDTESCGNAAASTDNCGTRDSASCAAGNRTFTRVTGTCSTTGGCGSTTVGPTTCSDPADSCANATRTTYEPTCSTAAGCGTPAATNTPCTQASGPSCGATGPNGQAALITYTAACDPSGNGQCSTTGAPQGTPQVCTPRVASTCDNTSTRIPQETIYAPACASGSACSPTGTGATRNCDAPSGTTCAVNNGVPQQTSYVPACENTARCLNGGRAVPLNCGAAPTTCGTDNTFKRPALTIYSPACADGTTCSQTGTPRLEACSLSGVTCEGTTERTPGTVCNGNACGVGSRQCPTNTANACSADRRSVEVRQGTCTTGTGCSTTLIRTSPCAAPTCGQVAGAAIWQACSSTCGVNTDGVVGCQASCSTCAPQICERAATGAPTGRLCGGCGTDANGAPICRSAVDCVTCTNGCNANTNTCALRVVTPVTLGGVISQGGVLSPGDTTVPGVGVIQ